MIDKFRERILERKPLRLRGHGSKDFYGGEPQGAPLDTREYCGIVSYEPTELVITARAGTPLYEIKSALAGRNQHLACDPPEFQRHMHAAGTGAESGAESGAEFGTEFGTLGGAVASGLSGPRRATVGSLRDFVLGVKILDGEGRILNFGGQVIKNVAGFDVSRLMVGSMGTLGLILEVSLKVLPKPIADATLRFEMPQEKALARLNRWAGQPLPLAANCWRDNMLTLQLSGAAAAVAAACGKLGGERLAPSEAAAFWRSLRDHTLDFFGGGAPLWRLSLPSVAPPLKLPGEALIEWGGAQRWLRGEVDGHELRQIAQQHGGHAALFAAVHKSAQAFAPLPPPLMEIHRRLKHSFDPYGIFNPGRLYPEF